MPFEPREHMADVVLGACGGTPADACEGVRSRFPLTRILSQREREL